jgi:hypothetical protein
MGKYLNLGGLPWVVLGVCLCWGAVSLRVGNLHRPGPGFMPLLSGLALLFLGAILTFTKTARADDTTQERTGKIVWSRERFRMWITPVLLLVAYIILFEPLGFIPATFFFLLALFKLKDKRWLMPVAFSAIVVVVSYLFFSVWLKAQFPKGILNIGV